MELWRASHVAESHGGGLILSPFSIVTEILDASSNARDEQIHRVTSDLARRLVATIPGFEGDVRIASGPDGPASGVTVPPPQNQDTKERMVAPETKIVEASRVNVRAGPGKDFPVMQQMTRGTTVMAISDPRVDGWTQVRLDNGRIGYVASPYLVGRTESRGRKSNEVPAPRSAPLTPVVQGASEESLGSP